MKFILMFLSIFSLSFLIKELDGPWGTIAWLRNKLIHNNWCGLFFYHLLSCYYCISVWSSIAVYTFAIPFNNWNIKDIILWSLSGAIVSIFANGILSKLNN